MQNRLRQLRRSKDLTLTEVATALGTTAQTVSRLENALITLSAEWLHKFGDLYDVEPGTLLGTTQAAEIPCLGDLDRFGIAHGAETAAPILLTPPPGALVSVRLTVPAGPYAAGDVLIGAKQEGAQMIGVAGHNALVKPADGPVRLGRLIMAGTDRFTLVPLETGQDCLTDAALDWAAKIAMRISYS